MKKPFHGLKKWMFDSLPAENQAIFVQYPGRIMGYLRSKVNFVFRNSGCH